MSRSYKVKSDKITDSNGKHWGDAHQVQTSIDYIDGLGKTVQKVLVSGSPTYKDIISAIEYNNMHRLTKEYLPVKGGGAQGNYNGSAGGEFYNNDVNVGDKTENYFTEYIYETLGRVTEKKAPGVATGEKTTYRVNFSNKHGDIKWYKISEQDEFRDPQDFPEGEEKNYPEGSLSVIETKDENGKKIEQFSDRHGRVVLKRVADQEYTYYVYNAKGLLRYILQPQFQVGDDTPSTKLERFAFHYSYDSEGRITSKKVPGQNPTLIEYYDNDLPKYRTDGNGKKFYYKYDALNRETEMGIVDEGEKPLVKTYYDNYTFTPFRDFDNELELTDNEHFLYSPGTSDRRGLVTGTSARVLNPDGNLHDNDSWLQTVNYYDAKGRIIQVHRQLHGLGSDAREQQSFMLDFAGNITLERNTQYTSSSTYRLDKNHTYDQQNRLLGTTHKFYKIVNDAWVLKKSYTHTSTTYNEIGMPSTKKLHGNIQEIKHKYTPRGWLYTLENNEGKTFVINLRYHENGNIKNLYWQTQNNDGTLDPIEYDDANRLKAAQSTEAPETNITYDKNGNIKTLTRAGAVDDKLTYNYTDTGNQLKSISDAGDNSGVKSGTSTFSYDNNGNMTSDGTRGATVAYNLLNLPRRVDMTSPSRTLQYVYDGTGSKLQMTSPGANTLYAGAFEYASSGTLSRIALEEGQLIRNDAGEYEINYYFRDHLGNVRQVLNENGDILQETEYYAFGLEIDRSNPVQTQVVRNGINRYNFLGKETQVETGYIDLSRRFYDPTIGRFMQVDPVTEGQENQSTYQYGWNNPILRSDPNGDYPDGGDDPFLIARLITTAFFDTKHAIINTAARAFGSDIRAGYKVEDGQQVFETQISRQAVDNSLGGQVKEAVNAVADVALVATAGSSPANPGNLLAKTSESQVVKAGKEVAESASGIKISDVKGALRQVYDKLGIPGSLPKGEKGKFGSPTAGDSKKGYRLDPAHPDRPKGNKESVPHINYWDWTAGKKDRGGKYGAIPLVDPK